MIDGLTINVPKDVYDPAEDSFLLAENVEIISHEKVLEVGSGSGYVSLFLASKFPNADFFCLDLNYAAIKATKANSVENRLSIEVLNCDLMSALIGTDILESYFDVVLFNTPYLPVTEKGEIELAWAGGKDGIEVTNRFIEQLPRILTKKGRCYIVVSSKTNLTELEKSVQRNHLTLTLIDEIKEGNEIIKLYLIRVNQL